MILWREENLHIDLEQRVAMMFLMALKLYDGVLIVQMHMYLNLTGEICQQPSES